MIEAEHLTKRYGAHVAVDDLSFLMEEGRIYGFLGPNGAGKTTTIGMLTGYLAPTEGTVRIDGISMEEHPDAAKQRIGYLPEVPPLYPELTVKENLLYAGTLRGMPKKRCADAVDRLLMELDLRDVSDRPSRVLSKGYRQRVGFAEALVHDPKILILDEPTAGLDPRQIAEVRSLIRKFGKDRTVLFSSHILGEVTELCESVLILSAGRKVAMDSPKALMDRQSTRTLQILTDGAEDAIYAALAPFAGRPDISVTEEEGLLRTGVRIRDKKDVRGAVNRALIDKGLTVYEMREEKENLEDIFLSLTKKEDEID